jgi:hypothetical protein
MLHAVRATLLSLYSRRSSIALGATAQMEVGTIGPVDVSACIALALERPNELLVIGAFEEGLAQKPLMIAVEFAFVGHARLLISAEHMGLRSFFQCSSIDCRSLTVVRSKANSNNSGTKLVASGMDHHVFPQR